MKKTGRLNMRLNVFYEKLLGELMKEEGKDKSFVVHAAIMEYAEKVLGEERVINLLVETKRSERK